MLHYAQDLKTPITMLHMLGVILPILGLVIFPLMGSFIGGLVKWYHLSFIYNIILPIIILTIGNSLLAKRPTGYSESEFFAKQFSLERFQKTKIFGSQFSIKTLAIILGAFFVLLGLTPIIIHLITPTFDQAEILGFKLLDFKCTAGKCIGPYSTLSILISLLIPLGMALAISLYYYFTTKDIIKIRKETLDLEKEFTAALFQLGNRVGDGIPVEIAFNQVAENMKDTPTGTLFRIIDFNIRRLGMSIKEAVFDNEKGAFNYYPSSLIETSMKVLFPSAKK
jgi:MFS family permease